MTHEVLEYINDNKLLFLAVLLVIVNIFATKNEHMTDISNGPSIETYVGKKISLTTQINGKKYILTSLPKSYCTNPNKTPDCNGNILVLIEETDFKQYENNYASRINDYVNNCNADQQTKCLQLNKSPNNCDKQYSVCEKNKTKFFVNMFDLEKSKTSGSYNLISNPSSFDKITIDEKIINPLIGVHDYKFVCSDKPIDSSDILNNITFLQSQSNKQNYVIQMNRQLYANNILQFDKGLPMLKSMYFSACTDNNNCLLPKQTKRVCLTDNISDTNILNFSIQNIN